MIIKTISLTNFRNHSTYQLDCDPHTSLIIGANGWGKTSVLEAIYILTRGKSFRATDSDIIKRGSSFYRINIESTDGTEITASYDGKTKTFLLLDKKYKRLPQKFKYPIVLFLPSDLNLISHSPSRRRDYFDRIFSEFDDNYANALSRYNKALRQRNELLKNESITEAALFSWDVMLSRYGTDLCNLRARYIDEFNTSLTSTYRSIAENTDSVNIIYKSEIDSPSDQLYLSNLEANFRKDSCLGHTSFGVHRDDYVFNFNQNLADGSASRGETRSIILALKFIEANLIHQKTNQSPIILLDDVFSELDATRRHCLIKNFQDNQVVITSVEKINL